MKKKFQQMHPQILNKFKLHTSKDIWTRSDHVNVI